MSLPTSYSPFRCSLRNLCVLCLHPDVRVLHPRPPNLCILRSHPPNLRIVRSSRTPLFHSSSTHQCWAKSKEQCQRSGWVGTFAGQGGGQPELIPARFSYQPESSRFIFFEPAIYIVCENKKVKKKRFHLLLSLSPLPPLLFFSLFVIFVSLSIDDFCLPLCQFPFHSVDFCFFSQLHPSDFIITRSSFLVDRRSLNRHSSLYCKVSAQL